MKSLLLPLLCLLLSACNQEAGPVFQKPENLPAIQIDLSNPTPKVGEPMELTLRITGEKRLLLPPITDLLDPTLEVLDSSSEILSDENQWVQQQHFKLALFQVTNVVLFADATVKTLADAPQEIDLPFQNIEVISVLQEEDAAPMFGADTLPDFRGPEALRRRKRNLIISAVAATVFLLGILLVSWLLARRPKKVPPPIPPHLIAKKEMNKLIQSEIWQRPDVDACAVALSLILRRYIEGRFEIRAPEQTTEEFLEWTEAKSPWPAEDQTGLKKFFAVTDQIKFAGSRPGSAVLEDLLSATRQFVESTTATGGAN